MVIISEKYLYLHIEQYTQKKHKQFKMKKLLHQFIILVAIFSPLGAGAQNLDVINDIEADKLAIVRQYDAESSIYYFESTNLNKHFFVLYSVSTPGNVILAEFPSNMHVYDFEIYEDYSPFVRITSNYWEMNRLNGTFPRNITFYPNPETFLTDTLCE